MTENYFDRLISENLVKGQEDREPSGKLSASKLYWPLQWQILATQFKLKSHFDEYTLRKFQRGKDVEDWLLKQVETKDKQKFLEYKGVIGYCDAVVDTKDWDNKVGVIPLEVKSVTNQKFKYLADRGPDKGHILQNALYALALKSDYHAITYVASDDYRTLTFIEETVYAKKEIDKIIKEFNKAVESKTIPLFEPREKWQANMKYNMFGLFAGLKEVELKFRYQLLTENKNGK